MKKLSNDKPEMQIQDKWVKVGEINTHYLVGGEGSPLVLIHGGASCADDEWVHNLEPLAQHHRIYAPDLVGFGKTDKPPVDYTFKLFSSFFEDFMNALELRRASIAGHSLGGGIALGFTLTHPDRVEKLILVDSNGLTEDIAFVGKLLIPFFTLKAKLKNDETYMSMLRNQEENLVSFLDRLPEMKTPTLIVWGEWDGYMSVKLAHRAHTLIKNPRLFVFKRCWHAPQRRHAAEFNSLVLDFLRQ